MAKRLALAHLFLIAAVCGCSDDDTSPVAADDPCLDEDTRCASFQLPASDMTESESYVDVPPETFFTGLWPTGGKVVVGYEPGRILIVTLRFNEPLVVQYDVPIASIVLECQAAPASCFDRWSYVAPSVTHSGTWESSQSFGEFLGACSTGNPDFTLRTQFENLEAGQVLRSLTWTVTVPETYTGGGSAGSAILPGDLDVVAVGWTALLPGDVRGNPPIVAGEVTE